MQQLVLCDESLYQAYKGDSRLCRFELDGIALHFALLNAQPPPFNPARQRKGVLVQKKAFSCNYRDKAFLFGMSAELRTADKNKLNLAGFGSEFVASVLAVGDDVTNLSVGDLVMGEVSFPAPPAPGIAPGIPTNHSSNAYDVFHEAKLVRVPVGLSVVESASFSIGAVTGCSMIRRLNLTAQDRVMVTAGRSNTSLFVLEMLKPLGLPIYTLCSNPSFDDQFRALGVTEIFHLRMPLSTEAEREAWNRIRTLSLTAIIDPFFDLHVASAAQWLDYGGRYVTCGLFNQYFEGIGQAERAAQYALNGIPLLVDVMTKNLEIIGNCIGTRHDMKVAIAEAEAGKWRVPIDSVWSGAKGIASFLERSFNASDRFGKVVFLYE